jgi:hypothetical protein
LYLLGMFLSFANDWAAIAIHVAVAGLWLIPNRRIERSLTHQG